MLFEFDKKLRVFDLPILSDKIRKMIEVTAIAGTKNINL